MSSKLNKAYLATGKTDASGKPVDDFERTTDGNANTIVQWQQGQHCQTYPTSDVNVAEEVAHMFDYDTYMGIETVPWDPTGTQYHRLYRGGRNHYYRVSDLTLKWRLDLVFSSTFLSEFKDGFVAKNLTDADFIVEHCNKRSVI